MHMNKRILSLTLALVMILGTFTAVFAEVTTVEQKAAEFLRDNGVLEGDEKGDLLLDKKLERRDAVVLSARLLGEEEKAANTKFDEKTPSWTDVRTDKFYVPFFAWAETTGRFEGKGEGIFEPRAGLTTQEYATVLLRILGHELNGKDAWKTVMELAKKEGLLENVDAKADDILMRGNMAVMTLNALGATVKGTGKTLADELNIKLPVPAKLEVEEVYADNLKEVKVVTNGAEITEEVLKAGNYSLKRGAKIQDVKVVENELILVLDKDSELVNKKDDVLTIKGTKSIDGKYDLKVYDNEAPHVVSVEALGNKAIKVTMSEPVKAAKQANFKLDGKNYFGKVTITGREITLVPYGSRLEVGEHELVVGVLEDFAKFKSVETLETFEVVEDKEAPEVVKAEGTLDYVDITFSEDVDEETITNNTLYWNKKANKATFKKLAGNKYRFTFKDNLPMYEVTLNISGVKDYSGNEMKTAEVPYKGQIDSERPELVDVTSEDVNKIELVFNKDLDSDSVKDKDNYTVFNHKDKKVAIKSANFKDAKDLRVVELELYSSLEAGKENTIKVSGVKDNTRFKNVMIDAQETFVVKAKQGQVTVESVVGKPVTKGYKIYVTFKEEMDIQTLVNADNYTVSENKAGKNEKLLSGYEDVNFDVYDNGKSVEITIEFGSNETVKDIKAIKFLGVRDINGKLIKDNTTNVEVEANEIKIEKAEATDRNTIELKMNASVYEANKDNFKGVDNIDKVETDGTTKVVLKLSQKMVFNPEITIELDGKVEGALGETVAKGEKVVIDKIRPEVAKKANSEDLNVTLNGVEAKIVVVEPLKAMSGELIAQDLVITNLKTNKEVKVNEAFKVAQVTEGDTEIKITFLENGAYSIAVKDEAKYIMDKAKNTIREMNTVELGEVTSIGETTPPAEEKYKVNVTGNEENLVTVTPLEGKDVNVTVTLEGEDNVVNVTVGETVTKLNKDNKTFEFVLNKDTEVKVEKVEG